MSLLSKVVWSEGMHLGPQHFQAQCRYFEDSIHFAASALWFEPYGLTGCALDAHALENGTVSVLHARGIFRDGLPFHMPDYDALPPARPVGDLFAPTRESLTVSLAIPERKDNGLNCGTARETHARYIAEERAFPDETTGRDVRSVSMGRKNIRLLFETEPSEGFITLPLARLVRDGSGSAIYDPEYISPCLQIGGSESLMLLVRRLVEILDEKSATLMRGVGETSPGGFVSREIANFWLLHAVNSGAVALRHLWASKRGHPEELFLEMSRLGGALCTFGRESHPRSLPSYDHESPGECFEALDRHIRTHLEIVVPTSFITIRLNRQAEFFYDGEIADTRCFGRSRWLLGIRSTAGEADLIVKAPQLIKICSAKFVGELVKRAMAGLNLTHLQVPPAAIPAKAEAQYFGISKSGPFWDHIVHTRRIGIYVPGDLPNAELELLVIPEN
jgi:type VI secretion system protein ImpJ